MREQDIKVGDALRIVGDRLRIRQWGDMKSEFGLDSDGNISCADMLEPIDELVEITPFTDDEMRLLLGI